MVVNVMMSCVEMNLGVEAAALALACSLQYDDKSLMHLITV